MRCSGIDTILSRDPVVLAPMAGITDPPFRRIAREMGCSFAFTEMISDNALIYGNTRTAKMLSIDDDDHPLSVQLFGRDPRRMEAAARLAEKAGADFIDINMGCPTPKITRNGEGAALMLAPKTAREIVRAVRNAVSVPVTVKTRKGWAPGQGSALEVAMMAEEEGASAIAVHGRYREQYYLGKADWDVIREVKNSVRIPVLGSGDVLHPRDVKSMLDQTSCDGVVVARGALGNPWFFAHAAKLLTEGTIPDPPALSERIEVALRHLRLQIEYSGEHLGVLQMRKHICWYLKGLPRAARIRSRLHELQRTADLERLLNDYMTKTD